MRTPDQYREQVKKSTQRAVDAALQLFDQQIAEDWQGEGPVRFTMAADLLPEVIHQRLLQETGKAGWALSMEYVPDQRDGDFYKVELLAMK